jgi:hypothetical protein
MHLVSPPSRRWLRPHLPRLEQRSMRRSRVAQLPLPRRLRPPSRTPPSSERPPTGQRRSRRPAAPPASGCVVGPSPPRRQRVARARHAEAQSAGRIRSSASTVQTRRRVSHRAPPRRSSASPQRRLSAIDATGARSLDPPMRCPPRRRKASPPAAALCARYRVPTSARPSRTSSPARPRMRPAAAPGTSA